MTPHFVLKSCPSMVSEEFFVKILETDLLELCHIFIFWQIICFYIIPHLPWFYSSWLTIKNRRPWDCSLMTYQETAKEHHRTNIRHWSKRTMNFLRFLMVSGGPIKSWSVVRRKKYEGTRENWRRAYLGSS